MTYFPMFLIFDKTITKIMNGIRDILQGWVLTNLENILKTINEKTATMAGDLAMSPEAWNGDIWGLVVKIAQEVALPVAGTVFVFVVTWELITMLTSPKMGDVDIVEVLIKWLLKTMVASFFISNSLNICSAFFGLGSNMIGNTKTILDTQLQQTTNSAFDTVQDFFENYMNTEEDAKEDELGQLLKLGLETAVLGLIMQIMGIAITVVLYSRMISIYLHLSVAPIPVAAITNHTFQGMGINYFKSVFALAMQGVLMMICVAIYGTLVNAIFNDPSSMLNLANLTLDAADRMAVLEALNKVVLETVAISVLLVSIMLKTETVTKSVFSVQ